MLKYGKRAARFLAGAAAVMIFALSGMTAYASGAKTLIPLGVVTGIKINTDGLMVAGLSQVETADGTASPAKDAGLREGDILSKVDGKEIVSIEDLKNAVNEAQDFVKVELRRENKTLTLDVKVCVDKNGEKKIGVWIRNSLMGIGTLTYYDPESGEYGCLGHAVNDGCGNPVPINGGNLTDVKLSGIAKGGKDCVGELKGDFGEAEPGDVVLNTHGGIFEKLYEQPSGKAYETGDKIEVGEAQILSSVSGSVKAYDIRIRAVYHGGNDGKDMLIEVTDDELVELTGGIVRGMSGSPVIQNGKLVGAVTHVLVSDPHKGYAISINRMMSCAEETKDKAA